MTPRFMLCLGPGAANRWPDTVQSTYLMDKKLEKMYRVEGQVLPPLATCRHSFTWLVMVINMFTKEYEREYVT